MGDRAVSTAAATQLHPAPAGEWTALARVMSASAAGAAASGLLSAAATKILAAMAGPAALGLLGTLQQLRQTALVAATANGQTALVQGLSTFPAEARREYLRTISIVFAAATACAAAALVLAPRTITHWAGLHDRALLRALAVALIFSSLFVFLSALLNALGAAGKLAWLQLAGPGAMALLAWPAARGVREGAPGAFPALLAASAAVTVLGAGWALWAYRTTLAGWLLGPGRWWRWRACRHFFSIATVMLATGLASTAALMAVRARIVRVQGLAEAGQFDAAWGISMNQVSLVLASLQTHYLPALARLCIDKEQGQRERGKRIARVITLAAPLAAAVIAALASSKPAVLTLLYSAAFRPAARYLRWTLLGDYFKVGGWILSIPMLAASDMRMFLAADLVASAVFAGTAAVLASSRGAAEAASIAFVLMNAAHLAICAVYSRRRHGFRWGGSPALSWSAGLALVGALSIRQWNT
jgi:O-antigen/teichoic acid export membrane protein